MSVSTHDALVIGGGLIGGAIAFGLARRRLRVALLDAGDIAFRTARPGDARLQMRGSERGRNTQARDRTSVPRGPNQMKAFVRCGMGPCQGRLCGLTVTELIAETRGVLQQEVGYYRIRPPVKPITVGDLASLEIPDSSL